jgi:hypothetical protein
VEETTTDSVIEAEGTKPSHNKNGKTPNCLNCGMPLHGESFCPNCGQKNDSRKYSAWELITEGMSGFFSFDSKVFRSLRPMLTRPGAIVLSYCSGKRSAYVHPARMYLSASIIYFLLQSLLSGSAVRIEPVEINLEFEKGKADMVILFEPDSLSDNDYNRIAYYIRFYNQLSWEEVVEKSRIKPSFWKRFYFEKSKKMVNMQWKSFMSYVKSKLPIILFLIIPVLALFLKLFYLRKGIYYSDHLIFAFYTQSALFLWLAFGALLDATLGTKMENVFFLVYFFYLYFSFRKVYRQGHFISLLKLCTISLLYLSSGLLIIILSGLVLMVWY